MLLLHIVHETILKMEAVSISEALVRIHHPTQYFTSQDRALRFKFTLISSTIYTSYI
jgi:hypothetical protein